MIFFYLLISLLAPASYKQLDEFLAQYKSVQLKGADRPEVFTHYYKSNKDTDTAIVFFPGMGEPAVKYFDLPRDLPDLQATWYLWDHVGQGNAFHFIPKETKKIHVDTFETHVRNAEEFLKGLRKQHRRIFVVAHSMGAHVVLRAIQRNPGLVDQLVLSSPMIDMNLDGMPVGLLRFVFKILPSKMYIPFYYFVKKDGVSSAKLTHSVMRKTQTDVLNKIDPSIVRDAGTVGWVLAALDSIDIFKKTDFSKVDIPVLLIQAGDEALVSNKAQDEFCQKLPRCHVEKIADSYHEILYEQDLYRTPAIEQIRNAFVNPKN